MLEPVNHDQRNKNIIYPVIVLNKPWMIQGYHSYYLVFLFFVCNVCFIKIRGKHITIKLCIEFTPNFCETDVRYNIERTILLFLFLSTTRRGSGWKSCYQRIWHILRWMTNKSETDVFTHQDLNISQELWFSIQEVSEIYYNQWQYLIVYFFYMFSYSCFSSACHQLFT